MPLSGQEIRTLYQQTVIVRRPTYGIVSGYHELPYVCLGANEEGSGGSAIVKGTVQVSPRFVVRPAHLEPSYDEVFGEDHTDMALVGRVFGYLGFRDRPMECKSEHLSVEYVEAGVDRVLSDTLDELERREDITTGVFITPNTRYFPVSIERFIASVVEDEFSV